MDLRVRALESVLVDKGYVDPTALDELIDTYETRIGPRNGARVVARAWVDARLPRLAAERRHYRDRVARCFMGRQSEHMIAVENTPQRHNLVVCKRRAAATHGRCWACPPCGTRARRTGRVRCVTHVVCWPSSA